MESPVISVHDVWFSYNGQDVLQGVDLELQRGDFTAMIGPNGGGKTTLLKLMLGIIPPDRGKIRVLGRRPQEISYRIGYLPQNVHINPEFPVSVLDVVLMGTLKPGRGWSRHTREKRSNAMEALRLMKMDSLSERRIGELSGGQRQRVLIARALVGNPQILFLDEPTASIDAAGQTEFYHLLQRLNERLTIVVVSHDMFMLSTYVKSVACVNRCLYYHDQAEITPAMMDTLYPSAGGVCPVELVAHGMPHRVLKDHGDR